MARAQIAVDLTSTQKKIKCRDKVPFGGIFPVLREVTGCGHKNLETPHLLRTEGSGRFVIDIGLGYDAQETLEAVNHGFNVLAFELNEANFAKIKARHSKDERFLIVEHLEGDSKSGWKLPSSIKAPPPLDEKGRGFAWVIHAGVSENFGESYSVGGLGGRIVQQADGTNSKMSVIVSIDSILPMWVKSVYMMKIDTQGQELKILQGARKSLQQNRFHYVLYEFSPWLMKRAQTGSPMELLELMPAMGAICFDMMVGGHNALPRPSMPLQAYFDTLNAGEHSEHFHGTVPKNDAFGPWDDILCYFPH
jgi:FkbM family methyltransferase